MQRLSNCCSAARRARYERPVCCPAWCHEVFAADAVPAENPQSADQRFESARQLPEGVLALDSFLAAEAEDYTGAETQIVLPVV